MSDLKSILSDDPLEDITEAEEVTETPDEPAEVEAEAEATEETQEEPQAEPEDDPRDRQIAGLTAALGEVRGELRAYRQQTAQPKLEPPKAPDVLDDPDAYQRFINQQLEHATLNTKLDLSEAMAREAYGDELVNAAFQALQQKGDEALRQSILGKPSPWSEMVKWHKKQSVFEQIGNDPEAWMKAQQQQIEANLRREFSAQQVAKDVKQVADAPSLATQPNLGGRTSPEWGGPASLDDILSG